jgi:hydrogenase expression/formation protein HypE
VEELFVRELANPLLAPLSDAALLDLDGSRLAFTTDAYVVKPVFFPGGSIGDLAVNGTVNDLAVAGARPVALSAGFVVEEGFPLADLRRVAKDMARAAEAAGVPVATGDTKVVERGKADGVYVTTAGLGLVPPGVELGAEHVRPGDRVLVSGTLGDHGMAVLLARGDLAAALDSFGPELRWMRDPTRGGLASALNELARDSGAAVVLDEEALPVRQEVAGACEILGIDPLYVANEGKMVAVVSADVAESALETLRAHPLGAEAAIVGEIRADPPGLVLLATALGGSRIVDMLVGDPLPRIC